MRQGLREQRVCPHPEMHPVDNSDLWSAQQCYNNLVPLGGHGMIHPYAVVGLFLLVSVFFGIAPLALAWLFSPKKANPHEATGLRKRQPDLWRDMDRV